MEAWRREFYHSAKGSVWSNHKFAHYGVSKLDGAPGRGSGRYPLGSGENPRRGYNKEELAKIEKASDTGSKVGSVAGAVVGTAVGFAATAAVVRLTGFFIPVFSGTYRKSWS